MRLLGAARLSHDTDASTSIERQREAIERYAREHGHSIVAITEDVDVSGAVSPRERPQLGPYLNGHAGQWDILVTAKLDRISRSVRDFAELLDWCQANGKTLVCLDPNIDLTTIWGQAMAGVIMVFAEMERKMTAHRLTESRAKTRATARWTGGAVPYGYEPATGADGHQYLAPKESERAVVERIAQDVIGGTSVTQIVKALNDEGVASQKGTGWKVTTVLRMLRNDTTRGYVMHRDEVVRDLDGFPVTREPLLDADTWDRLQAALSRNATGRGAGGRQSSPMLVGVARCASCGENMYARRMKGRDVSYYVCRTAREGRKCASASISMADLETAFAAKLLATMGDEPRRIRVDIPAEDHTRELAEVDETIASIEALVVAMTMPPVSAQRMLTKLNERREELADMPQSPARVEWKPAGQTIAMHWAAQLDWQAKRDWLIEQGITVKVMGYPRGSEKRWELSDIARPAQS